MLKRKSLLNHKDRPSRNLGQRTGNMLISLLKWFVFWLAFTLSFSVAVTIVIIITITNTTGHHPHHLHCRRRRHCPVILLLLLLLLLLIIITIIIIFIFIFIVLLVWPSRNSVISKLLHASYLYVPVVPETIRQFVSWFWHLVFQQDFAGVLTSQWENSEETYIDSCKKVFGEIRRERELIHRYFYGTRCELRNWYYS